MARSKKPTFDALGNLADTARAAYDYVLAHGYRVKAEHSELGYPFGALLQCKRGPTTMVVDIGAFVVRDRAEAWWAYGKSCSTDFRYSLGTGPDAKIQEEDEQFLRTKGLGWYSFVGGAATEKVTPQDLGLNVALPKLGDLHAKIRPFLAPAFEEFARGSWKEGFQTACGTLEEQARRYFRQGVRSGRILVVIKGTPTKLGTSAINKMTMGQLAGAFARVHAPNFVDSKIGDALATLNDDRIAVVHKKNEKRLRQNVGQHMYRVIAALKLLQGVS